MAKKSETGSGNGSAELHKPLQAGRPFISRHLFTILAILLIAFVGFAVPQVKNLFELPTFAGREAWLAYGFYAYVIVLVIAYLVLGGWIVPLQFGRRGSQSVRQQLGDQVRTKITANRIQWLTASLLASIGFYLWYRFPTQQWIEPFGAPFLLSLSQLTGALFIVLLFWYRMDQRTQLLWLRIVVALFCLNVLGEGIWALSLHWPVFSPRNYTLWAILHIAFCVVLFARVVDFWSSYSYWVRPIAVLLVAIVVGRMPTKHVGQPRPMAWADSGSVVSQADAAEMGAITDADPEPAAAAATAVDPWLMHLRARLQQIPDDDRPVVMIAASGGGSRAALFTSLVYEFFDRAQLSVPNEDPFSVSEHLLLISSVSGGTLASACYVDSEYRDKQPPNGERIEPRQYMFDEIRQLMNGPANLRDLGEIPWCDNELDRADANEQTYFGLVEEAVRSKDADKLWFLQRSFVDDMCTDFMAPLLRGALHMPVGRGQSVRRYWENRFGLTRTNLQWREVAAAASDVETDGSPWPPLLLCNVSEVASGTRLIVGFPPLPPDLMQVNRDNTRSTRAWVNLDPMGKQVVELRLSEAVRLSANFPWGFPIASTKIEGLENHIHLIDGGVVDNTGIDAIRAVFQKLYGWTRFEDSDGPTANQRVAKEVFAELHRRSVLLIEIDSGAKPGKPGWVSTAFSGILEPISALENAAYANATAAVQTHLYYLEGYLPSTDINALRRRLTGVTRPNQPPLPGGELEQSDTFPRVKKLKITCNHQENVMTAWALGPNDKATIFLRFLAGSERLGDQIANHLEQRSFLLALEEFVADQEAIARSDPGQVDQQVVASAMESLEELAFVTDATQKKQDLESKLENLFYQRASLPQDSEMQAIQTLPRPKLARDLFTPKKINVAAEAPPEPSEASPRVPMPVQKTYPTKQQYEKVDAVIQEYDSGLRGVQDRLRKSTNRLRRIGK